MSTSGAYQNMLVNQYGVDPFDLVNYDPDSLDVVVDTFSRKNCDECEVGRYGDLIRCDECYDRIMEESEYEDNLSDAEADAMTLASAGYGTDEDYGFYGEEDYYE